MWWKLGARDLGLLVAFAALWTFGGPRSGGDGAMADFLGVAAGLGFGIGHYLLHEWGHAAGGFLSGSVMRPATTLRSRSLFSYDSQRNSRPQFLVMSVGGFLVTGVVLWAAYSALPPEWLATRVARGSVLFLVALTVVIEFPLVLYALIRNRLPPVETFDNPLTSGMRRGPAPAHPPDARAAVD